MTKKNSLGRGLGALIEEAEPEVQKVVGGTKVDIRLVDANPFQPRSVFDQEALEELTASIKELGVIQPITVREMETGRYQLITGERRFRAASAAGLTQIPAYIRTADDQGMLEMALVENIQREDLNAVDIAISYQRLVEECSLTQENLSLRVGKKRATVANYLRLLKLPAEIQVGLRENRISMGHARALITISDIRTQLLILHRILEKKLSVRQVEDIVRTFTSETLLVKKSQLPVLPVRFEKGKEILNQKLHTDIKLKINSKGSGFIIIPFQSDEDFDRILSEIGT